MAAQISKSDVEQSLRALPREGGLKNCEIFRRYYEQQREKIDAEFRGQSNPEMLHATIQLLLDQAELLEQTGHAESARNVYLELKEDILANMYPTNETEREVLERLAQRVDQHLASLQQ